MTPLPHEEEDVVIHLETFAVGAPRGLVRAREGPAAHGAEEAGHLRGAVSGSDAGVVPGRGGGDDFEN